MKNLMTPIIACGAGLLSTAATQATPTDDRHVIAVIDNGTGFHYADKLHAQAGSDPEGELVETALGGFVVAGGDLARGHGLLTTEHRFTLIKSHAGLTEQVTALDLYNTPIDDFVGDYGPKDEVCAPLEVPFQALLREMKADPGTTKVVFIYASLFDVAEVMCHGGSIEHLYTEGPKPEYGLDEILGDESLSAIYFVGSWIDKRPSYNAYVQEHKHPALTVRFLNLRDAVTKIDMIMQGE